MPLLVTKRPVTLFAKTKNANKPPSLIAPSGYDKNLFPTPPTPHACGALVRHSVMSLGGSRAVQWLRSQANNGAASRAGVTGLAALAALPSSQAINPRLSCGAASTSPAPPPPTNAPAQGCQAVPNITLWALTNPVPGLGRALAVAPVSSGRRSKTKPKTRQCAARTGLTARAKAKAKAKSQKPKAKSQKPKAKSSPWCRE